MEESLKNKIKKLLALQEGAAKIGSIEEAANAAEKVRALLLKHNLDLYSIQKEGQPETVETHTFNPEEFSPKTEGDWVTLLIAVIARHHLCSTIGTGKARSRVYVIGKPSNAEMVHFITEQLINRIRPMARGAFKNYKGFEKRNTFIRGFLRGAVQGISAQLSEAAAREKYNADQDAKKNLIGTTALMTQSMMLTNKIEIEKYIKEKYRVGPGKQASKLQSTSGRAQGYEAGKSININKGLGSNGPKATKFLG